ncbi:hypothetical protein [Chryseobacterium defluvii]|uniref:Uncharacterized protein n=1 Tax=Chryseobacterium defluvii TaxID=160396 RepID=A0A495SMK5_9FLAO|nr:hypothetical protein [Chryseobacterium defluvii]RKT01511.1 hypothetical protein BCF58_0734 [Chryseobacterium defluvii]
MSVRGSFHFRLTNTGNLIGEYMNNVEHAILSESANRINEGTGFVGEYITSWVEDNQAMINNLKIEETSANVFKLVWSDLEGNPIFEGKATLLEENTIYGHYSGKQHLTED